MAAEISQSPEDLFPTQGGETQLERLVRVMDRLRSPGGCSWDAEQDHRSLLKFLIEESYELVDAIESDNRSEMKEELGDVLLQVYFHSRIAQEHPTDPFSIEDVAEAVSNKLISRHTHVFGDVVYENNEQLLAGWEAQKQAQKGRTSPFEGVPLSQPALSLASKVQYRLEKLGHPVEVAEPIKLSTGSESSITSEEFGEILLGLVAQANRLGIDPENALRSATKRFMEKAENNIGRDN
jgi:XTP/dITP diphosphohydrolase